jgi:hypothetical protein
MASTSEELAGQADKLQETAAFFKTDQDHTNRARRPAQMEQPVRRITGSAGRSAHMAVVPERHALKQAAGGTESGTGKGVVLDLSDPDDSEFERY